MLTTIEKVIFLQDVEVFRRLTTDDLLHIAAIAEEITIPTDTMVYKEGSRADAMYLVLEGSVSMHQEGTFVLTAKDKEAFGTWALFDEELRVVTAKATSECKLLRIDKDEFIDLLADNVGVTQGIIRSLVHRVRGLVSVANRGQNRAPNEKD